MSFEPGRTVSHYRLLEKIGQGGMGIVWKAEDTVLGRSVAIKFLPPSTAGDQESRLRFLEEARLASSLSDAHIAQVHELGREGDLDFIVMEHVEGQPLSRVIAGRPIPAEKVVSMGLQVARALARAHHRGLLHRDIKPGNILVTADGDVKVVDFGLATLLRPPDSILGHDSPTLAGDGTLPEVRPPGGSGSSGPLYGTPYYMSPEQARGEPLDPRSDIFSLGVVLYQMTTGSLPFPGDTIPEVLERVSRGMPAPPHELTPGIPLELDRIVMKALAPRVADRYQTMDDLAVDLKRLGRELETGSALSYHDLRRPEQTAKPGWRVRPALAVGLFVALGVALAAALWLAAGRGESPESARTVLVLPFKVRGQAEGADFAGHAFAEAIAINLAQGKDLGVLPVPPTGAGGDADPVAASRAARSSGAGRVLSGTLVREGGIVRATLSLVDVGRNRMVWGAQKETDADSLPALAAALAREIAKELGASPPRLYDYFRYGVGSAAMSNSPDLSEALGAIRRYEYAKALDSTERLSKTFPNEADALVLRCVALAMASDESSAGSPERARLETCLSALERLDPVNPWQDVIRATLLQRDGAEREADERFSTVLARVDLTPAARAYVLGQRSMARSERQDHAGAMADTREAVRLDPASDFVLGSYSSALAGQGNLEEALVRARQALALNPTAENHNDRVAAILYRLGRYEESLEPFAYSCEAGHIQQTCAYHAIALWMAGRSVQSREAAARAALLTESAGGTFNLACYHALAGERADALRLLRRSIELGPAVPSEIESEETLASLHGDPEFESIVAEAARRYPSR